MKSKNKLVLEEVEPRKIILSQKRALIYKYKTLQARVRISRMFGLNKNIDVTEKSNWNHYIAAFFYVFNIWLSNSKYQKLIFYIPNKLVYIYMLFTKVLTNF